MRVAGIFLLFSVGFISVVGCDSEEPPPEDDEGTTCPEDLLNEVQIIQNAVAAFDSYVDRHVKAATPACNAIIQDLGGNPPPTNPTDPTVEELTASCGAARQIVQTQVMMQSQFSFSITDPTCNTQESQDACTRAHPIIRPSSRLWSVLPSERKNACSVASMKRKKFEKWTMPAMSVSTNSTRRSFLNS